MLVTLVEKNSAKVSERSWGATGNELMVHLSGSEETFKSLAFFTAFQSDFELPVMIPLLTFEVLIVEIRFLMFVLISLILE